MFKKYKVRDYRFRLIIYLLILGIIGILAIGSANESFQGKQILGMFGGFVLMLVVSFVDYHLIVRYSRLFYVVAIILLILVLIPGIGQEVNGATRWMVIGGGENGIQFQPSEFAKILLILFFSGFFFKNREKLNTPRVLIEAIILFLIPAILILREPNLSTTIITTLIFITLLFIAGLSYKIILGALAISVPLGVIGLLLVVRDILPLKVYQRNRIMAWIDPAQYSDNAYQQQYSIRAIASGQVWGKGLRTESVLSVKNGHFISEPQNDFIYAIVGEEMGFAGCLIIIILLGLIVMECIIAARQARDMTGRLIACGIAGWIGFQSIVNISVATGLMPNTGVPLPFVSYGLTSLFSLFIGMGLILNIGLQKKKYKAEDKIL